MNNNCMRHFKKSFLFGTLFVLFFTQYLDLYAVTTLDMTGTTVSSSSYSGCVDGGKSDITQMFTYILCVLDSGIIPILISIGLIIFIVGVVRFVAAGENEEQRQAGRQMMIYGIIALFVMVAVWGFVNLLSSSLFGESSDIQSAPKKSDSLYATE